MTNALNKTTGRPDKTAAVVPAQALRARIRAYFMESLLGGVWQAGHRVPAESELMRHFGASRMTVHSALRELQAQGYLVRGQGLGSFVAEPKSHHSIVSVPDMADEIRARGANYAFRILSRETAPASPVNAAMLGLSKGNPVFRLTAGHLADGCPAQRIASPNLLLKG